VVGIDLVHYLVDLLDRSHEQVMLLQMWSSNVHPVVVITAYRQQQFIFQKNVDVALDGMYPCQVVAALIYLAAYVDNDACAILIYL
jgi:hypothetical protein